MNALPSWRLTGLTALTLVFGLQTLRALLPLLVFGLRDRLGWSVAQLGGLVAAVFVAGFLAGPMLRLAGRRGALAVSAGGTGLLRLAVQIWTGDPLVDLGLAIVATALFQVFLRSGLAAARRGDDGGTAGYALGILAGLVLDVALHGAYATYDPVWRDDPATTLLVLALVAAQLWLLAKTLPAVTTARQAAATASPAWPWLALGPFLFLQLQVFGNVARAAALTGWSPELAWGWVLAGQVAGLSLAAALLGRRLAPGWLPAVLGAVLVASLLNVWPRGLAAAVLLTVGQITAAGAMAAVTASLGPGRGDGGRDRFTTPHGLGMLLLAVLVFVYYSAFNVALPFPNHLLQPAAALLIATAAVAAGNRRATWTPIADRRLTWAAALLLLLPLARAATAPGVTVGEAPTFPLRVMSYNLHCGFDPRGFLGLEALARAIEAVQPDVVALQEVSRGWAINGSVDTLSWLSRRLAMPYRWAPTADPLWGNAILSKGPFLGHESLTLPPAGLPISRGLAAGRIAVSGRHELLVLATHYHHLSDGSETRQAQSRAVLDFWRQRPLTVLLGDLNAEPGAAEIELLRDAGFRDALAVAGSGPGFTNPAVRPFRRIDYVWLSPDLQARHAAVSPAVASDHLGVVADIEPRFPSR